MYLGFFIHYGKILEICYNKIHKDITNGEKL